MKTEDEAKKCWCPFARVAFGWAEAMRVDHEGWPLEQGAVAATVNRGEGLSAHTNCIASECMAWRWWDSALPDNFDASQPVGYCGLAGKP